MFSLQAKHQHGVVLPFDTTQVTSPGNYSEPKSGQPCHPLAKGQHPPAVAYGIRSANSNDKQRHAAEAEKARSLDTTGGFAPAQGGTVIAYPIDTRNALRTTEKSEMNRQGVGVGNDGEPAPTLTDVFQPGIAYGLTGDPTPKYGKETMPSLRAEQGGEGRCVANRMAIRHLTPRECERLQGFPDDWTRWDADGNEMKDGPRYRMLGNAVAMPVTEWIGRRIVKVRDDLAKP